MFRLTGFVLIMALEFVVESVEIFNYCDLQTKFCDNRTHVACPAQNGVTVEDNSSLGYSTRLAFLQTVNKNRKHMKIKWDSELEKLSALIDFDAKHECFTSRKFVDVSSIQLKYCENYNEFNESALTSNAMVESIGCTMETKQKSNESMCYLVDCLYNFSNQSTSFEHDGVIQRMNPVQSLSPPDVQNASEHGWNWKTFMYYYDKMETYYSELEPYEFGMLCSLFISVWLANFFILILVCSLKHYLSKVY